MKTDVTEALDNVGLAPPAGSVADHGHVLRLVDEVLQPVEHSSARGAGPAVDPALVDRLPGHAGRGVHVLVADSAGVGVGYPGHLSLTRPHVGSRHVDGGAQEAFLGELDGEPPGDKLQLIVGVVLGVDLDAAFASSEGNINTGALVCHESGQSLDFVLRHVIGVPAGQSSQPETVGCGDSPDPALAGTAVVTVLGSVPGDHLVRPVVSHQREVDLQHVRAGLYQSQDPVTLGHLLLPGNPLVLHVVIDQSVLHHHAETERVTAPVCQSKTQYQDLWK